MQANKTEGHPTRDTEGRELLWQKTPKKPLSGLKVGEMLKVTELQISQLLWFLETVPAGGGQNVLLQQSGFFKKLTVHCALKTSLFLDGEHRELRQDVR